jgi:hypothetical protein
MSQAASDPRDGDPCPWCRRVSNGWTALAAGREERSKEIAEKLRQAADAFCQGDFAHRRAGVEMMLLADEIEAIK